MSSSRAVPTFRPAAARKAIVQRRYQMQDEACEQAITLLLAKAAGVTSTNGGEPKGSKNDRPAEKIIP